MRVLPVDDEVRLADGVCLGPAARTVRLGAIELTARELAVLELLLRRRGEAVSKTEVLDAVWSEDFDGDPNIVEVYVGRLRRKVDRPFGRQAIQTVGGSASSASREALRSPLRSHLRGERRPRPRQRTGPRPHERPARHRPGRLICSPPWVQVTGLSGRPLKELMNFDSLGG